MPLKALQHINIRCTDVEATREFYSGLLGLTVGPRPPFASFGYWLYAGDIPVVHIVQRPQGEAAPPAGYGALDHAAFECDDLEGTKKALREQSVVFREAVVPRDGTVQLFVRDPDGVPLELNFASLSA